MELRGKIGIITGASSGIGSALARACAAEGMQLTLAARSLEKLEALARELPNTIAVAADMTNRKDIERMVEETRKQFGGVDILINNAGQGYRASIEDIHPDTFRYILDLNVIGPLIAMQQVIPLMRMRKGGMIVNINSGTALMAIPHLAAYSSSKRALVGISLTAQEELRNDNIVVSAVYPYITQTDFAKNTIGSSEEEIRGPYPGDTPEFVAQKIIEGIQVDATEVYVHDWMREGHTS